MIRFFNRGSTSVECVEKGVYRVNDSVDYTEELKILGESCILNGGLYIKIAGFAVIILVFGGEKYLN